MPTNKLRVAILWHFHQPYYRDIVADEYVMPWVRLHALKDYYDMGAILGGVAGAKATFNFVPSLLLQLQDYVNGTANDAFLELAAKPADALEPDERAFVARSFFYVNRRVIAQYPRYVQLTGKRDMLAAGDKLESLFSVDELRDLQVLFNLCWCGNTLRRESDVVKALDEKRQGFTEEDKAALLAEQSAFVSRVCPLYSELASEGHAELSTTPFYHPILPILKNAQNARECMPNVPLPENWKGSEDDAKKQAADAVEFFSKVFGMAPRGMWPAEGSVSQDTCEIYKDLGINWIATDEAILFRSLNESGAGASGRSRARLYSPYCVDVGGKPLSVFFRDHGLSDAIGFVYSSWDAQTAVADFISRLKGIFDSLEGDAGVAKAGPPIVSVILDGENAWQYYPENGEPFLSLLYSKLVETDWIDLSTFGQHLDEHGPGQKLPRLAAGSWIRGDFGVWIGHPEDNEAWDWVQRARQLLTDHPPKEARALELAWQSLFAAEGSDWNWWYGDDHHCDNIDQFDWLFRKHVENIYTLTGQAVPPELEDPIKSVGETRRPQQPKQFIQPVLDGRDTSYFEWIGAGLYHQADGGRGAMHQVTTHVRKLFFGFDEKHLFVRLDFSVAAREILMGAEKHELIIEFTEPSPRQIRVLSSESDSGVQWCLQVLQQDDADWLVNDTLDTIAVDQVAELAIPFESLDAAEDQEVRFSARLVKGDRVVERIPHDSAIEMTVPGPDFEREEWYV